MISNASRILALGAVALAAATLLAPVQAQQVYRIVGPDGKVTFSDKPPPPATSARVTAAAGASGGGMAPSSLPFELRQVASKYPVTLYTGDNCGPCAGARSLLVTRGIPFTERTVTTADDSQALQRLSGDNSLPFATIGGQQLKGFSDAEWTQFLNAAGYPTASVLPASYRQPPAAPLVTVAAPPVAGAGGTAASTPAARPAAPAVQPAPSVSNPAGIKF
ncbi:MAG: glutaredoxin family protein [Polaromonas sp.]|nr:glutaredoxin family protein [Polaromonas sp.]